MPIVVDSEFHFKIFKKKTKDSDLYLPLDQIM